MSLRDELAFHFLFRSRSVTRIADLERQLKEAFQSLFVQVVRCNLKNNAPTNWRRSCFNPFLFRSRAVTCTHV